MKERKKGMDTYKYQCKVVNKRDRDTVIYYNDVVSDRSFYDERGKLYHRIIMIDRSEATFNKLEWEIYRNEWVRV